MSAPPAILLLGAAGQVGFELRRSLANLGAVSALTRAELDLEDLDALRSAVRAHAPAIIVNAAAYTAVDRAEEEPQRAARLNADVPRVLADEALRGGAALVHYSTDYVFAGDGVRPYREDDATAPLNRYGETKRDGEDAVLASGAAALVLRTSWVYGLRGRNFLLTMRRLAEQHGSLRVVDDQFGAPTWSRSIADATAQVLARGWPEPAAFCARHRGIYHLTAAGSTSWCGFARRIVEHSYGERASAIAVTPIKTAEFPTPARRPAYSVLDGARLTETFGVRLPDWADALALALEA